MTLSSAPGDGVGLPGILSLAVGDPGVTGLLLLTDDKGGSWWTSSLESSIGTFHLLLAHCRAGGGGGVLFPLPLPPLDGLGEGGGTSAAALVLLIAAAKPVARRSPRNPS